ncbi:MAG: hypothetical protein KUA35_10285 [Pseudodesulfovibrio sp.]|uniref:Uncharacterized protein n=1 Tax=Pseudodesulfovibrio aespoeensis (strain ATCC 700646 / DSM 10631 / Aspo-2) TaxID=643562 RepID=E6VUB2_PSEA9|nr:MULTISPECIES: hypothetical protein [Pseudodesulfovibrio]MBU4191352.1 hypothetical protein [Pseudomonadota bacterium]ADU63419.1 hypothetical protein Daes_2414 [Pseudodesulfovibrio aespoeensis Aspo-2]MBU4243466.1 hypothetical protein [Pseudomonadota bacterium]MBU4380029.1 hypothetical protein [Pseudomonadota bacterium]MBU4473800.1 hypothetical protein [Pseudomonadota bacterium]
MDFGRIAFFSLALLSGISAAIWGQPLIHGNESAVNIIVTVFSILSGFLIAVITIIGDPSGVASRNSWRFSELNRNNVNRRLIRNKWMFVLYLITLTLIFLSALIKDHSAVTIWIERAYLGLAVMAFVLSFRLPWALVNIQMRRYDELIDEQRKACGINGEASQSE